MTLPSQACESSLAPSLHTRPLDGLRAGHMAHRGPDYCRTQTPSLRRKGCGGPEGCSRSARGRTRSAWTSRYRPSPSDKRTGVAPALVRQIRASLRRMTSRGIAPPATHPRQASRPLPVLDRARLMSVDLKVDRYELALRRGRARRARRTTARALRLKLGGKLWCRWADSNRRPCAYETHALTG
jgi:hypothetical protein